MKNEHSSTIAAPLGILSFIGMLVWAGFITVGSKLTGMGDGAGSIVTESQWYMCYTGSLYLFLVCLNCLPFMRGRLLIITGIITHLVLAYFAQSLMAAHGGVLLIPFLLVAAGWLALYKERSKREPVEHRGAAKPSANE